MLSEFLTTHRAEIIRRARAKVAERIAPRPTDEELEKGVPLFLDQLVETLRLATPATDKAIGEGAARHGGELLRMGFTIGQVVHDYGDVCQSVTELAVETHSAIEIDEFRILNKCLDDAIAEAVTEYTRLRAARISDEGLERSGSLAHELRNKLHAATLAFSTLKGGRVGIAGSTGAVLERNLRGLRDLIDRSLAEVRIDSKMQNLERIELTELIEEIALDASLEANAYKIQFNVGPVPQGLAIKADRPILTAAVVNLLQNAFKFSHSRGRVSLVTSAENDRVLIRVEDACGGLPPGKEEELFRPFVQKGANRKGLGLGLNITRKGIESLGGTLAVRDIPGTGCVFTISLPRAT
jgi:signal transduction histidine kinase